MHFSDARFHDRLEPVAALRHEELSSAPACRARWRRALATLPHPSIEHHRRRPARDRSKKRALQVSEAQTRIRSR